MYYDQKDYDIRCEWGAEGLSELLPGSHAIVIVDVLSFSTCVDIVVENGAMVYPYRCKDRTAAEYAWARNAIMANFNREYEGGGYSLAPSSLVDIPPGTSLVLPSPNGSALSLSTGNVPTFAGCLRNASVLANKLQQYGTGISIIPAGERWKKQQTMRPAIEDLVGAGAIIHALKGSRSPEAVSAVAVFKEFKGKLESILSESSSGRELIGRGFERDVRLAAALDVSNRVPMLVEEAYRSPLAQTS